MYVAFAWYISRKVLAAFRVPRSACRGCAISTTLWKPVNSSDDLRSQLNTSFANLQAFVINPAFAAYDIEVATGISGCHELSAQIDRFFETAKAAAFADFLPVGHYWGNATRMRCW